MKPLLIALLVLTAPVFGASLEITATQSAKDVIRFSLRNTGNEGFAMLDGFLPEHQIYGPFMQIWVLDDKTAEDPVRWRSPSMASPPSNRVVIQPKQTLLSELNFREQMRGSDWDKLPEKFVLFWTYKIPGSIIGQDTDLEFQGGLRFKKTYIPINPRELPTEDLVQVLSKSESESTMAAPRLASVQAILGPADKTAPSPQWRNSQLNTYLLSDGRRLELTASNKGHIYLGVIITKSGNTLVFK